MGGGEYAFWQEVRKRAVFGARCLAGLVKNIVGRMSGLVMLTLNPTWEA